jgi:hypothetical protein
VEESNMTSVFADVLSDFKAARERARYVYIAFDADGLSTVAPLVFVPHGDIGLLLTMSADGATYRHLNGRRVAFCLGNPEDEAGSLNGSGRISDVRESIHGSEPAVVEEEVVGDLRRKYQFLSEKSHSGEDIRVLSLVPTLLARDRIDGSTIKKDTIENGLSGWKVVLSMRKG